MSYRFEIAAGASKKLLVGGKYCEEDIIVTALGGSDAPDALVDALIDGSPPNITEIESGATAIRGNCFENSPNLKSVSFPNATTIGVYGFKRCANLTSATFPNVTSIGEQAFANCSGLTSVYFPNAELILVRAFLACAALKSVSFPNVDFVGNLAFANCSGLKSVSFPKINSISTAAFANCTNCLEYDFGGCEVVPILGNTNAFNGINSAAKIKVPAALYDEWIAATNWTIYAKYIVAV